MSVEVKARPIINSPDQYEVLSRYGRGGEIAGIVTATGFSNDFVAGVVSSIVGFDRGRARTMTLDYDRARKSAVRPVADLDMRTVPDTIAGQLDRAEATGDARLVKLVGKVRTLLVEITERSAAISAELEAAAAVAEAQRQLDAARARLRAIRNAAPASVPAPGDTGSPVAAESVRDRNAKIREWAARSGLRVAARGMPGKDVVRAYEAAMAAEVAA